MLPRLELVGRSFGPYFVESEIGHGGMSVLFLARDDRLGRSVALKIMAPELSEDEDFRRRFLGEARAACSIDHPNIVPIYEAGEQDGRLFIAMRYVPGSDLGRLLRRGPLPPERALDILDQAAEALDTVHRHGLVHRDVKPANILMASGPDSARDHVYLSDFGLTKRSTRSAFTRPGTFLGTPDYAAPEQFMGGDVDRRADIYSLGCVLVECLTGEVPFPRETDFAVMHAHTSEPPPSASERAPILPREIDEVVARALAKDPSQRFADCRSLTASCRALLGTQGATGGATRVREAIPSQGPPPSSRKPAIQGLQQPSPEEPRPEQPRPEEPKPRGRVRRAIPAAVGGGLIVVALLAVLLLSGRGGGETKPVSVKLEPASHPGGVLIERTWTLSGDGGDSFRNVVRLSNPTTTPLSYVHDEVVPKSLAPSVDAIRFVNPMQPHAVPKRDPVVRFGVPLQPGFAFEIVFDVPVKPQGAQVSRLRRWEEELKKEELEYRMEPNSPALKPEQAVTVGIRPDAQVAVPDPTAPGQTIVAGPATSAGASRGTGTKSAPAAGAPSAPAPAPAPQARSAPPPQQVAPVTMPALYRLNNWDAAVVLRDALREVARRNGRDPEQYHKTYLQFQVAYVDGRWPAAEQKVWSQYPAPGTPIGLDQTVTMVQWDYEWCVDFPTYNPRGGSWCFGSPPTERVMRSLFD